MLSKANLVIAFVVCIVCENMVAGKISVLFGLEFSGGIFYMSSFLITDIIGEIYGKEEAKKAVKKALFISILVTFIIFILLNIPDASDEYSQKNGEAFKRLFSINIRITIASIIAYVISQNLDILIFHGLKSLTGGRYKWLRNNTSTITSQFIDSLLFITIAFYGIYDNIFALIMSQYIIKIIAAIIDTIPFYILTSRLALKKLK